MMDDVEEEDPIDVEEEIGVEEIIEHEEHLEQYQWYALFHEIVSNLLLLLLLFSHLRITRNFQELCCIFYYAPLTHLQKE